MQLEDQSRGTKDFCRGKCNFSLLPIPIGGEQQTAKESSSFPPPPATHPGLLSLVSNCPQKAKFIRLIREGDILFLGHRPCLGSESFLYHKVLLPRVRPQTNSFRSPGSLLDAESQAHPRPAEPESVFQQDAQVIHTHTIKFKKHQRTQRF